MHLGAVSVRLCPRAALTAPTPCGRFVRVWAIAAPAPATAAADAAAAAITTTGSVITSGSAATSSVANTAGFSGSLTGLANSVLSQDSLANFMPFSGRAGPPGGSASGNAYASGGPGGGGRARRRRGAAGGGAAPRREATMTGGSLFTRRDGTLMSGTLARNATAVYGFSTAEGLLGANLTAAADGTFSLMGNLGADGEPAPGAVLGGATGAGGRLLDPGINALAALTLDRMVTGLVNTYDDVGIGVGDVGVTHYVFVDEECPNVAEVGAGRPGWPWRGGGGLCGPVSAPDRQRAAMSK
jgi:hypothetical protein